MNAAHQLTLFEQRLPKKPYYSDDLSNGLSIIAAKKAVKSRYIQHNGPTHKHWLVFDVDRFDATMCWDDLGAPAPNIVATNRENGHAHLIYGLEIPVRTAPDGSSKALRYAAAVEAALRAKLGADEGYTGLICKNPLNPHWLVSTWEPNLYTLDWLADYLDLSAYSGSKRLLGNGLGRNCNLFDYLSKWAFKAIRQGYPQYDRWLEAVLTRAQAYNNKEFTSPLPLSEVKATAKSVAKFTHKNFSAAGFSAWQARQGAKGGRKSKGGGRPLISGDKATLIPMVLKMKSKGYSNRMIAEDLKISASTVSLYLKHEI
ncbi:replication initiation protein [Shewanella septentrionalis]|uniref:Replication initiation protein n=1 Tax=Shewanella septentrionalis TaxID=2952223 RepID=A0A9X2WZ72_9GAMM|nr:replication initiation protein [Shewanella septentrionalis]MCT7948103.1 replication initiation protein [Shewanella septentrionalis]